MSAIIAPVGAERVSPDAGIDGGVTPAKSTAPRPEISVQGVQTEERHSESAAREIAETIEQFNQQLAKQNLTASYVFDPETQSVTIFLVNPKTGDVERTIPPMPSATAIVRLSRGIGALVDGYL